MADPEVVKQIVTAGVGAAAGAVAGKEVAGALLGPGAKEVGDLGGRLVKMALGPLRGLVWGYERIEEWLERELGQRLKGLPPEQIKPPAPEIVVPALRALTYTQAEELRDMFANLLARSMDRATARDVHPSFVEVIKQLTPDEAKILSVLPQGAAFYTIHRDSVDGRTSVCFPNDLVTDLFRRANCSDDDQSVSISNLERLNLARFGELCPDASPKPEWLEQEYFEKIRKAGSVPRAEIRFFEPTPFGQRFTDCCIRGWGGSKDDPATAAPAAPSARPR